MGFIQHPAKAEALPQRGQTAEIRAVAVHRVHALRDDEDDAPEGRLLVQHELKGIEVIMREASQARAGGHDAFQHAGVHQAVGEDEVPRLGQAAEHGGVRRETGVQNQAMRIALPRGQGVFELLMQLRVARDERGGRRRRPPRTERGDARFDHDRVAREAKVIVIR